MSRVKCLLVIFGGLFAACSFFGSKTTQKAAPDELFYVSKYNLETKTTARGFMGKTGKFAVGPWETFEWNGKKYGSESYAPLYFEVMQFVEGMAGICFYDEVQSLGADGKCGFINVTGKIVVEPKYKQIGYFSDGLAAVSEDKGISNEKFGYIDKTGKVVIEPRFVSKNPFSDGLAAVREFTSEGKEKDGYIDKTGKYIESSVISYSIFGDGHAVGVNSNGKQVIVDKSGKEIKEIKSSYVGNTDKHYKETLRGDFYRGYTVGDLMMPAFSENLAMVQIHGSRTDTLGYISTKGEMDILLDAERVGEIRPFADGFAPVGWRLDEKALQVLGYSVPEGTYDWTFVDRKGDFKVRLDNTFIDARPFSEGLAAVKPRKGNDRWGFINTEFKLVIPACFNTVNDFRAGLAMGNPSESSPGCEQYGGAGSDIYIDKTGNVVKPQW